MTPNLSSGKTEFLFSFRDRGWRAAKLHYGPLAPRKLSVVGEYGIKEIRLVTQHVHLGGIIHHRGDLRCEIKKNLSVLLIEPSQQESRLLLANSQISFARRVELFSGLVLSKLTYGTESWLVEDQRHREPIHSSIIKLHRRLLGQKPSAHLSDDCIMHSTGLPSPSELLRLQHLRYLGTLIGCSRLVDWGLLNTDARWKTLLEDDLRWLWRQLHASYTPS